MSCYRRLVTLDILSMRSAYGAIQVVTLALQPILAEKLLHDGRVRIRWVACRVVRRWLKERFFRCWSTGHRAKFCGGSDRTGHCFVGRSTMSRGTAKRRPAVLHSALLATLRDAGVAGLHIRIEKYTLVSVDLRWLRHGTASSRRGETLRRPIVDERSKD